MMNNYFKQIRTISQVPDYSALTKEMRSLQNGGNVDLFNRPQIDVNELKNAGWKDVGDGIATVFSSTYTNRKGDRAGNFTPIMTDIAGNYLRTMNEPELTQYAEGVMEGNPDVYGLRIGATTSLNQAIENAERIHQLQEAYYNALVNARR